MNKKVDLLNGPVLSSLTRLALPIMATSVIQMAYNLIDMVWIGRLGSQAVAAVGAAGMYMWLSNGVAALARMGTQVHVGYALGSADHKKAGDFASIGLRLSAAMAIVFGLICLLFSGPLIQFFRLSDSGVIADAGSYLRITCGFIIFSFLNQTFAGLFTAMGSSRSAFISTSAGLVLNLVLDPLLIFGPGPFPSLGIQGAAIATVFSQSIVCLVFIVQGLKETQVFPNIHLLSPIRRSDLFALVSIGLPVSVQSMLFTGISMIIARFVASYGDSAIAVQKVGSQIESISWMTGDGFAAAVNSFIAQNRGAGNKKRIREGYYKAMGIISLWGLFCTLLLIFFPEPIFRIFIKEAPVVAMGIDYLVILGISQFFMSIEITTAGAFSGYGRTVPPALVSIVFTAIRIPLAFYLMHTPLGLNGIWWALTISSMIKGVLLVTWFMRSLHQNR